jgi:hypothetical protein
VLAIKVELESLALTLKKQILVSKLADSVYCVLPYLFTVLLKLSSQ